MTKPSIPQGTRDFGPETVRKRSYIFSTIRAVFELYGFEPLETPAFENLETLTGKYGEEGDQLIFKILNNGLGEPKKIDQSRDAFENVLQGKSDKNLTERALKYDLTIPFARYVAMNHGQLVFPFKRYQIQPVWRADKPQRGRYREFTQCDVDVVGSNSLLNELELVNIYHEVFTRLQLTGYEIRISSRKILLALAECCAAPEKLTEITVAIDKLEKIGLEKVQAELAQRGLTPEQIDVITRYLSIGGTNDQILEQVTALVGHLESGQKGIAEVAFVLSRLQPGTANCQLDLTLARGLNYYTGLIFEVKAPASVKMGSIGGGGRYDDLTGLFGVTGISGVGISFGVDRIYDVLEALQLFPETVQAGTRALFFNLGEAESAAAFMLMQQLRQQGISCELYHESVKFDKQFKYADRRNIPFAVIIGSQELQQGTCVVKNLRAGQQETIEQQELVAYLSKQV